MVISVFYKIKYGLRNLWRWRRVIWNDRDWDYAFLFEIMEFKLRLMSNHFEKYSLHAGADKDIKHMRLCASLLQRVNNDDYCDDEFHAPWVEYGSRAWVKNWEYKADQDLSYFSKIFTKYVRHWWC